MRYKSEELFLDNVERCLKENGCQTWREVIPDNCIGWDNPYRVDLIFYRNDFGYIGVEGKNLNSLRSAKKISDAIDQINNKYKPQTYFDGNIISRWCIAAHFEVDWISKESHDLIKTFLKNFLNSRYKISLMEYIEENPKWNWKHSVIINAGTKNSLYIRSTKNE